MEYASKDIRNILVAGHAGCGKTTLVEALLYQSGATERMGRVEDGTTASDFDPEEVKRKASLNSSVVPVEIGGTKFNLIDAPGLFDFETGACEGVEAAESVLICVSGRSGRRLASSCSSCFRAQACAGGAAAGSTPAGITPGGRWPSTRASGSGLRRCFCTARCCTATTRASPNGSSCFLCWGWTAICCRWARTFTRSASGFWAACC